ncbi:MAG: TrbI/VirB10 family protein [bacterium]
MTENTPPPNPDPQPSAPTPEGGSLFHGPGPRLRRAGRTAAILAVVAVVALLMVLTANFSHDLAGSPSSPEESSSTPVTTSPLSPERVEEFARRHLQRQLRANQRPPAPPELPDLPDQEDTPESIESLPPPAPPSPPATRSSTPQPSRALDAPLAPSASDSTPGRGGERRSPPRAEPPSPRQLLARIPEPEDFFERSRHPQEPRNQPSSTSSPHSNPPLDRRTINVPAPEPVALHPVPPPAAPTLYARTTIPLALTHAVNTDVPGPVRAYVLRDIYDSLHHATLLVPRGTLAIGHQAAHAAAGDQRVLIYWTELKLPSGASLHLPNLLGGSQDGSAGVVGDVDNHWWSRFGSAIGLSLVGTGTQLSQPQERTAVQGLAASESQVLAQQLGLELGRLSREILRRGVNRPPTISLQAGERLSLILTQDLAFPR